MKRYIYYLAGISILYIMCASTSYEIPAFYYGSMVRDDVAAPMGTEISVWIEGDEITSSAYTTRVKGIYGPNPDLDPDAPFLTVSSDYADSGDVITFKINGFTADQTVIWNSGGKEVNLTCSNCDHPPSLNGSVEPLVGYTDTTFTFTVYYSDVDNDAPSFLNVEVGGDVYEITGDFSDATTQQEYKDGKEYQVQIAGLPSGIHTYKFSGSDGFVASSSAIMDGPTVYERTYIGLNQGWNLISLPFNPI